MPDITELLETTTPRDVPPVDLADLAHRARQRHRRERLAGAAAVILAVAAIATTAGVLLRPDAEPVVRTDDHPAIDLREPVGTWIDADDPASSSPIDAFAGTLSDGRVLVWGGRLGEGAQARVWDGGIYAPVADEWEAIPSGPFRSLTDYDAQLADDRLAAVAIDDTTGLPTNAAVYDVASSSWSETPTLPNIPGFGLHIAWDGDVLALAHIPQEPSEPPAATMRWELGADDWQSGAAAPLGERMLPGTAFDGERLAVWGGATESTIPRADGAIYDVAADSWQTLPDAPIPGRTEPVVTWWNGLLVVGGGEAGDLPPDQAGDLAAFDPTAGDWRELPSAPGADQVDAGSPPYGETDDSNGFLISPTSGGSFDGAAGYWFFDGDDWYVGEFHDLHQVGDLVVATSRGLDAPAGSQAKFDVQVHAGGDRWVAAAEEPRISTETATVAATETSLVVVDPSGTWVLDLAAGD